MSTGGTKCYFWLGVRGQNYLPVPFSEFQDGNEVGFLQVFHQAVRLEEGVAVEVWDLVQFLEVITQPGTCIGLQHHNNGEGPGTGRFFSDAIL